MWFIEFAYTRYAELSERLQPRFKALHIPVTKNPMEALLCPQVAILQDHYLGLRNRVPYLVHQFSLETRTMWGFIKSFFPPSRGYFIRCELSYRFLRLENINQNLATIEQHLLPVIQQLKTKDKHSTVRMLQGAEIHYHPELQPIPPKLNRGVLRIPHILPMQKKKHTEQVQTISKRMDETARLGLYAR
jgi:hypothetical protein